MANESDDAALVARLRRCAVRQRDMRPLVSDGADIDAGADRIAALEAEVTLRKSDYEAMLGAYKAERELARAATERAQTLHTALRCLRIERRGTVIELCAYMPDGSAALLTVSHATEAIPGIVLGKLKAAIDAALAEQEKS